MQRIFNKNDTSRAQTHSIGDTKFFTSEKFRINALIGHTIIFTSGVNRIVFSRLCEVLPVFVEAYITMSRFVNLDSINEFIESKANLNTQRKQSKIWHCLKNT